MCFIYEKANIHPGVCCLLHPLFWDFKFYVFFWLTNRLYNTTSKKERHSGPRFLEYNRANQ